MTVETRFQNQSTVDYIQGLIRLGISISGIKVRLVTCGCRRCHPHWGKHNACIKDCSLMGEVGSLTERWSFCYLCYRPEEPWIGITIQKGSETNTVYLQDQLEIINEN